MKSLLKKIVVTILTAEAKLVLRKYRPQIVAITGSVGKTSTKDAIYTVLSAATYVRKSQKSFNSEIGIPLTILGRPNAWSDLAGWLRNFLEAFILLILPHPYPRLLILEVGADRPGDIEKVTRWIKPDVSVITKLSDVPVHVEFFRSPAEVAHEKSFLAQALKKDGTLVLNADDEEVMSFAGLVNGAARAAKIITFGFDPSANVRASDYEILYEKRGDAGGTRGGDGRNQGGVEFPVGIKYKVNIYGEESREVVVRGSIGKQNAYTTLAAIAVGISEELKMAEMVEALSEHETPPGRMKIIEGVGGSVVIDDSYNSSPVALKGALEALKDVKIGAGAGAGTSGTGANSRGKKIAILGDMLELGSFSAAEHRVAGEIAAGICSVLITVGLRARAMREAAIGAGMSENSAISFDDSREAGEYAKKIIGAGDVVLVKGSQGTLRMERAVEVLMAQPEKKEKLLVRQENEWKKR